MKWFFIFMMKSISYYEVLCYGDYGATLYADIFNRRFLN